jgi:hypothetical protein
MQKHLVLALACAGLGIVSPLRASPFAAVVVSYNPGGGYAAGYTNTAAVLGPPSTADSQGDAVTPFDPPYQTNQILSIGAGGWVTVEFDAPIVHWPDSSRDFIIFGDSFFVVTNYASTNQPQITGGAVSTDGGQTQVSVSRNGVAFYRLNPSVAPQADDLYPTDGSGNFQIPVNPGLLPTNFAGLTLAQVRALYNGSAGGASYNIAWAQDTNGNSVCLPDIRYVRLDVFTNRAQISGFAAVAGTVIFEDFSASPAGDGWAVFGQSNLFAWNSAQQNLRVTWDSSQPNSYFYHPLGTIVDKGGDFSMSFDLQLTDYAIGVDPSLPTTFELAAGLQNYAEAASPAFLRGGYPTQPDLVEFDFFPADNYGSTNTAWPTFVDSENDFYYGGDNSYSVLALPTNLIMRVSLDYTASNETAVLTITTNGSPLGPSCSVALGADAAFADFLVNTFAIESYNDAGQDPSYGGSLLAHGMIDNVLVIVPPPPVLNLTGALTNGAWQTQFSSRTHWNYILESSSDLKNWLALPPAVAGTGGTLTLQDTNALQHFHFYRVTASHD